jgi:hypothetical protein
MVVERAVQVYDEVVVEGHVLLLHVEVDGGEGDFLTPSLPDEDVLGAVGIHYFFHNYAYLRVSMNTAHPM